MADKSPGQRAYAAYWQVHADEGYVRLKVPFHGMPEVSQHAWEAAAEAAITAWWQPPAPPAIVFRFVVGQRVTWNEAPGVVWQIIERRHHEGPELFWRTYDLIPATGDLVDFHPLCASESALEAAEENTPHV